MRYLFKLTIYAIAAVRYPLPLPTSSAVAPNFK